MNKEQISPCLSAGMDDVSIKAKQPTPKECGPDAMPREIAPIKAPFYIPQFKRPEFPKRRVLIATYGAVSGGEVNCRQAINNAIIACSEAGGGRVLVPAGTWLTGRIDLKSNVELHLSEGAELHFSGELTDYLPAVVCRNEGIDVMSTGALIYAYKQKNIAVTGKGKIIGPPLESPIRSSDPRLNIEKLVDVDSPLKSRIYDGQDGRKHLLPYSMLPLKCQDVFIESISIERSAMWNIVPTYCENVVVRGVRIDSRGIKRGDGINISSCRFVLVEYCSVQTGDDCYCLKAGRNEDGVRIGRPTENVVHRFNVATRGHGAITCGSETAGMIRNIYVISCRYENVGFGIRFKTRRPRGGGGENLTFENLSIKNVAEIISWDMLGAARWVGELAERFPKLDWTPLTPVYRDTTIRSVVGTARGSIIKAEGIPESPICNILIEKCDLRAREGISFRDAKEIILRDSDLKCKDGTLLELRNVQHFQTQNCRVEGTGKEVHVAEATCENIDLSRLKSENGGPLELKTSDGATSSCVLMQEVC